MNFYKISCVLSLIMVQFLQTLATPSKISAINLGNQCIDKDRKALLKFKNNIIVDRCGLLSSWQGHDCCQWGGVHCDQHSGRITTLDLRGLSSYTLNNRCLEGNLSASLLELNHLNYLDVSFNNFHGQPIPNFIGSLTNLTYLNLSNSNFKEEIPHQLGNLSKLTSLDLNCLSDFNPYDRPIVTSLSWLSQLKLLMDINLSGLDLSRVSDWFEIVNNLPQLRVLNMTQCQLSPQIPSSISYLNSSTMIRVLALSSNNFMFAPIIDWLFNLSRIDTSLVHLDLSYCFLVIPFPERVVNLYSLEYLDLSLNLLVGSIPQAIWDMPNLAHLSLSYSGLEGPVLFPEKITNRNMSYVDLSGNGLEVTVELIQSLGQFCSLQELNLISQNVTFELDFVLQSLSRCAERSIVSLDLSDNAVWGSVPDRIGNFSSLRKLVLYGNQLNGTISPSIGQLSMLEELDLSSNALLGTLSHQHLSNLPRLRSLSLSENPELMMNIIDDWTPSFQLDSISLSSCKLGPNFPKWLQTQTNFSWLDISNSGISNTIPMSFWKSLSPDLQLLDMSNNSIHGSLPEVSIIFHSLPRIHLSSNYFTGAVPSFLSNSSMLYLDNNLFSNLLPFLTQKSKNVLTFLDLSNNLLSGELPDLWINFDQLTTLYLNNNNISGTLPSSIGEIKPLQALQFRNNSLSGQMPAPLENCTSLVILDLGYNSLTGNIPSFIGTSLKNLGVLLLRSNNFVGKLPSSLCQLSHLQTVDISMNQISGIIPTCIYNLTAMKNRTDFLPDITAMGIYTSSGSATLLWKKQEQSFSNTLGLVKSIDLSFNRLEGSIPSEISVLIGLISLDLSRNSLNGSIPLHIGELSSLEFLDLSNNQLSGTIPISLAELSSLEILDLANNNLSGKIPMGTQLQGFNGSVYSGNSGLCGDPLPECAADHPPPSDSDGDNSVSMGSNGDDIFPGLYISIVLGLIIGFWGVCGSLVIKTSWRYAFFKVIDEVTLKLMGLFRPVNERIRFTNNSSSSREF